MRSTYADSFALLKERVEIIGDPRPTVTRPPRHDDEDMGPSVFRVSVDAVSLEDLTLPGLYVARSELKGVSFRGSDLRLAAFNWSDLLDCDFTGTDLTAADLRACRFARCSFRSADLSRADLRGSSFQACVFDAASMAGTRLYRRSRLLGFLRVGPDQTDLPLSETQGSEVAWLADAPEPGGG